MARHRYLLALGSNRRHHRHGRPQQVLGAALAALEKKKIDILKASPVVLTAPVGPSQRRYANAAAIIETSRKPEKLLALLKKIERKFGRRPGGQRWAARVIDLDIVLWEGGSYASASLTIPHALFRERSFVLAPARAIAPDWRDPLTNLSIRHLTARLTAPRPLSR